MWVELLVPREVQLMIKATRSVGFAAACILWAAAVGAQTTPASSSPNPPPAQSSDGTRPATTTFFGDTGIWFVPIAETLPAGQWSVSGYRRSTNWVQGYTNVSDFAGTFAVGIAQRAELFGAFLADTRIDRDTAPIFINTQPRFGGINSRYPFMNTPWTSDNVGDFYVGGKVSLLSEARQNPAALALRATVKLPTADKAKGVGTGKTDVAFDAIVSKEAAKLVEMSGYTGWEFLGNPDNISGPTGGLRWGAGITFPSRNFLRVLAEVDGEVPNKSTLTLLSPMPIPGLDLSQAPVTSTVQNITRATVGLTLQTKSGFFAGAGISWSLPAATRNSGFAADSDVIGDYYDLQLRIGYHPGARTYSPPPPPPAPQPPPPPAPQNRPPTVRAQCDPCTVVVGGTSTVTGVGQDPDGDTLTYRWSAPAGTFQNAGIPRTVWTAPQTEGPVPATVTVNDGHGGTASDSVTIQVIRPRPVVELNFEDVYFDFDRSTLRPEALRLLDDAVSRLQANPDKNIIIEGHTCSIGTAEYNLALGNRRATSVRDYLLSRGVPAGRMETRSYGEERPKYDNAREETRRLNRRAALVVKVQ
jgi:outer membrane protein OmpA-like peptidoglycan-associated protein